MGLFGNADPSNPKLQQAAQGSSPHQDLIRAVLGEETFQRLKPPAAARPLLPPPEPGVPPLFGPSLAASIQELLAMIQKNQGGR